MNPTCTIFILYLSAYKENILKENNKLSNKVGELKSSLRRLES